MLGGEGGREDLDKFHENSLKKRIKNFLKLIKDIKIQFKEPQKTSTEQPEDSTSEEKAKNMHRAKLKMTADFSCECMQSGRI